jgi:hypothetical protein
MTEALVDEDPRWMDAQDVTAVLAALEDIAVSAKAVHRRVADPSGDWVLCLHWLQHGPVSSDTEAALPAALGRIREYFLTRCQTPPTRLELLDPDDELLLTVNADGRVA